MPLFVCSICGSVDNTALTRFWSAERTHPDERLCSACETGEWHGRFPREQYDASQKVQWIEGRWVDR